MKKRCTCPLVEKLDTHELFYIECSEHKSDVILAVLREHLLEKNMTAIDRVTEIAVDDLPCMTAYIIQGTVEEFAVDDQPGIKE